MSAAHLLVRATNREKQKQAAGDADADAACRDPRVSVPGSTCRDGGFAKSEDGTRRSSGGRDHLGLSCDRLDLIVGRAEYNETEPGLPALRGW